MPHAVNTAVTELYELGVASGFGGSTRTYGTNRDMSRADMAAFMAAILDHSNLRPKGVNIQVSPTRGSDDFDITAMISVRSDSFDPEEDQAVDWFYTADPDGGLERNGECDISEILGNGDCEWQNSDDETNRDGNIFEEVRATAGETMTFYAWIGRRNGDEFDEDNVVHSKATAISEKGPSSLLITHDVPVHAWQVGGTGAYIVDLDRRSSVEFTIQLQDANGVDLERDGVVIDIDVDSREILVDADDVTNNRPTPDYRSLGRDTRDSSTVVTNRRGEATFELDGPSRDERLDDITIETDCCTERIRIAWSNGESVLVSAQPSFKLYQYASSNGTQVEFTVQYDLYDQYGNALRGHTTSQTGRQHDVGSDIKDNLYTAGPSNNNEYSLQESTDRELSETWSRGRVRADLSHQSLTQANRYLIVIKPDICSSSAATNKCDSGNSDRVEYTEDVIVWVVKNATDEKDFSGTGENVKEKSFGSNNRPSGLKEVELYSGDGKFRTFFTLWSYDNSDRFQAGGEDISIHEFEKKWDAIDGVEDIEIPLYTSALSLFIVK